MKEIKTKKVKKVLIKEQEIQSAEEKDSEKTEKMKKRYFAAAACSDKGKRRQNNEDNFCLNGRYMKRDEMDAGGLFACKAQERAVFAVCDGMGGEDAGEEASLLSVQLCAGCLQDEDLPVDEKKLHAFLLDGCISVMKQAQKNENRSGSTVSIIVADEDGLHAANMGDSRIYRMTEGNLVRISEDHTEMQRLLRRGLITKTQAQTHPKRHMILQYWGMPLSVAPFSPYIAPVIPYVNGDRYLICSDGLTDMLEDKRIEDIVGQREKKPESICRELVQAALENGGRDNVTVLVFEVHDETGTVRKVQNKNKPFWQRVAGKVLRKTEKHPKNWEAPLLKK